MDSSVTHITFNKMNFFQKCFLFALILGVITACSLNSTTTPSGISETKIDISKVTISPYEVITSSPGASNKPPQTPIFTRKPDYDSRIKVLFIGNSYTFYNDLPEMFRKLMEAGGYEVLVGQSTYGGWSLSNHITASETTDKIANTAWDYIILQEQSVVTHPEISMYPAVREINKLVESIGAKTVLFMTWGRKDGLVSAGYPDYQKMQAQIANNYYQIADELDLTVVPVGLVWQNVRTEYPEIRLWNPDGSHPSKAGSYLAACVFYEVLTGESPEGLNYMAGLPEEDAKIIQHIFSETAFDSSIKTRFPTDPITFEDAANTPRPTTTPTSEHKHTLTPTSLPSYAYLEPINHQWQSLNNCHRASIAALLGYYDVWFTQHDYVIGMDNLDDFVSEYGLKVRIYTIRYSSTQATDIVRWLLAEGFPVIVGQDLSLEDTTWHYRVARGYDDKKQEIYVSDSLLGSNIHFANDDFNELSRGNGQFIIVYPVEKDMIIQNQMRAWQMKLIEYP